MGGAFRGPGVEGPGAGPAPRGGAKGAGVVVPLSAAPPGGGGAALPAPRPFSSPGRDAWPVVLLAGSGSGCFSSLLHQVGVKSKGSFLFPSSGMRSAEGECLLITSLGM